MSFTKDTTMLADGSIIDYVRQLSNLNCESIPLEQYLSYFNGAFESYPYCDFMNVGSCILRIAYIGYQHPICMFYKSCPGICFNVNGLPFKLVCINRNSIAYINDSIDTFEGFLDFDSVDSLINILLLVF